MSYICSDDQPVSLGALHFMNVTNNDSAYFNTYLITPDAIIASLELQRKIVDAEIHINITNELLVA